jgi:deoxyribodipyrimidine photo-lyase
VKPSARGLWWFRSHDLRLDDQSDLCALAARSETLLPVFCLNPDAFRPLEQIGPKIGPWRTRFLWESLSALEQQLRACGSGLYLAWGRPAEIIPPLVTRHGLSEVWCQRGLASEETAEENELAQALGALPLHGQAQPGLLAELPFALAQLPETFSAFHRRIAARLEIPAPVPPPAHLPPLPAECQLPAWPDLSTLFPPQDDPRCPFRFRGGAPAGETHLRDYLARQLILSYKQTRNGLCGPDFSSRLSPWLANGNLSVRRVYAEIRRFEAEISANESTEWLVFELLWREYFRWIARKHGTRIFAAGGLKGQIPPSRPDRESFARWCQGQTGEPLIDAGLRELRLTGWTSNRARQNLASYLVHDLQLPWRWGARWFESQLLDYDVCSNWGNWMYLAGVGNDPRQRRFNPERQTAAYDPNGDFCRLWLS